MHNVTNFIATITGKNLTHIQSFIDYGLIRAYVDKDKWGKNNTTYTLPKVLPSLSDNWGSYYCIKPITGTESLWEEKNLQKFLETPIKITPDRDTLGWLKLYPAPMDPLTQPVFPPHLWKHDAQSPQYCVPIGITEQHTPWLIQVQGTHILLAGATSSGKGSVLWSLIHSMREDIHIGLTQLWVIDPKGGMELGLGAKLFTRFSYTTVDSHIQLLRDAVEVMHTRAQHMRGTSRKHSPTQAHPLIVIIIDELAALTAYISDRKTKTEIENLLSLLLSQGRAVGVSIVAALQDPSKDVLPFRQLFPTRIGLRMTETSQTQMILGTSAHEAGAYCELISEKTPGVGYMILEDSPLAMRARAFHITDTIIYSLTENFPAPTIQELNEDRQLNEDRP